MKFTLLKMITLHLHFSTFILTLHKTWMKYLISTALIDKLKGL